MATKDLTVSWTKPGQGGKPVDYTVQGRKTGTTPWADLATNVAHKETDPQTTKVPKATLDQRIPGLVAGDTIDLQVRGINTFGAGPWRAGASDPVPGDPPGVCGTPTAAWG